ncbi:MAG: hypothetical protein Q8R38_00505 [Candidatus Omnitrophota bacterium]|nr:hypothetical protein [Candidatus Omnitrophota bacterium]
MWYFIIIISVLYVGFFIWATIDYRKKEKVQEKDTDKSVCRSENSLDEYGKKMNTSETPECPEPEE